MNRVAGGNPKPFRPNPGLLTWVNSRNQIRRSQRLVFATAFVFLFLVPQLAESQNQAIPETTTPANCFGEGEPGLPPDLEKSRLEGLSEHYRYWFEEDIAYIITPEERCAFLRLKNDTERDQFVEQFWMRRAADKESLQNDFQAEHYRRIVSANEHFSTAKLGWSTDRGRVYIVCGPPDNIDSDKSDAAKRRLDGFAWEAWHYRYLDGIGRDVQIEFVNPRGDQDYRVIPSTEGKSVCGLSARTGVTYSNQIDANAAIDSGFVFFAGSVDVPKVHYKELEAMVVAGIRRDEVEFGHRVKFQRATHATVLANILVSIPANQLAKDTKAGNGFAVFGHLSRADGWVVSTFELSGSADSAGDESYIEQEVAIPLSPGFYQFAMAVKDASSERTGTTLNTLQVPTFEELEHSETAE